MTLKKITIPLPSLKDSMGLSYFYFFYQYSMQGIPAGFALTALANYLIGKGISAVRIGTFDALVGLPWIVQFIWGPVVDKYQYSAMGLRKQWIVYSQVMTIVILSFLITISDPVKQIWVIAGVFMVHSIAASIQDAAVDGTAISLISEKFMGRINAFMRLGMLLGVTLGAAGFSAMLHRWGFNAAAIIQVCVITIFTAITYAIKFDPSDQYRLVNFKGPDNIYLDRNIRNADIKIGWLFKQLYKGITAKRSLGIFSLIALVYLCMSIFIRSLSFHLIHNLSWRDQDLSVMQGTWGSSVNIVVLLTGGLIADRIGPERLQQIIFYSLCIFLIAFGLIGYLWVYKYVSSIGVIIYSLADPLVSICSVPVLMKLCLPKVEGSQFTTYMAMVNLCDVLGAYISGFALTYTTAPVIGVVCGFTILLLMIRKQKSRTSRSALIK